MPDDPVPRFRFASKRIIDGVEWERARCRRADPDLFFPKTGDSQASRQAKAVCERCEIIVECGEWAVQHNREAYGGIFGGMTQGEREDVRRERRKRSA